MCISVVVFSLQKCRSMLLDLKKNIVFLMDITRHISRVKCGVYFSVVTGI